MAKKFLDAKLRRIVAIIGSDNRPAVQWWTKGRRIWPDDSERGNALRVQLPEYGTLEWAYWVHAVDAVRTLGASDSCYLRFHINGKYYYLIDSPDGSVPLALDGNMAYYETGESFPADGIGASVPCEAKIPWRNLTGSTPFAQENVQSGKGWQYWMSIEQKKYDKIDSECTDSFFSSPWNNPALSQFRGLLPIIPNTRFQIALGKGGKEENVRGKLYVYSMPGDKLLCSLSYFAVGGRGVRDARYSLKDDTASGNSAEWVNNTGNQYHAGDYGYKIEMRHQNVQYGGFGFGAQIEWPAFNFNVNLPVININTAI